MGETFLDIFPKKKPILAMVHLKGDSDENVMERFHREMDIYVRGGVDAVIIENYFGRYRHMELALHCLQEDKPPIPYGVNCLNSAAMGFELAIKYNAAFIQVDSVVGHVKERDEDTLRAFFKLYRSRYKGKLLGGVRFKYQPVLSEHSVEDDLTIAMDRCDAICVTQDRTGQETSMDKIIRFREAIGDFPLIIGAGLTPENMEKQFAYADGAIVGSYFKEGYVDRGEVSEEHVARFIACVEEIRRGERC